jgi:hypothetical protein
VEQWAGSGVEEITGSFAAAYESDTDQGQQRLPKPKPPSPSRSFFFAASFSYRMPMQVLSEWEVRGLLKGTLHWLFLRYSNMQTISL